MKFHKINFLLAVKAELAEKQTELKTVEERSKKSAGEAARLAEELRQEQDRCEQLERARRTLEGHIKEFQVRLEETEAAAVQGGKRIMQKMEGRVRELEAELENEQHRHGETVKSMRRQERRLKELAAQIDEDRQTHEKLHDVIEKLHQKLKNYKRHVDETVSHFQYSGA